MAIFVNKTNQEILQKQNMLLSALTIGSKIQFSSRQKMNEDNQKLSLVVLLTTRFFVKELTQKCSSQQSF